MARLPPLNWLRAFEASARALSFTEAAQELHMTQSAVSQQIKSLESALGRQLFHRRARGLELTDIGRGYLPTVQAAFNTLEEGTAVLTGRNEPDVLELHSNISFAIFWLTPRLQDFMGQHPWVNLDVATSIWPTEKPRNLAAVEIVLGLGKWEGRAGQRLTRDTIFPVCTPQGGRAYSRCLGPAERKPVRPARHLADLGQLAQRPHRQPQIPTAADPPCQHLGAEHELGAAGPGRDAGARHRGQ